MHRPGKRRAALGITLAGLLLGCRTGREALDGSPRVDAERAAEDAAVQVWRVGRTIPAGLPAARAAELEVERGRALERLRAQRGVEAYLGELLTDPGVTDELWCAAARTAAALELYPLAADIGVALAPAAEPTRAVAARAALHDLYGRWFTAPEALAPYRESVRAGPGTALLLETGAFEETRSRERLLAELTHDPSGAAAWLADPDPHVRSGAARILGQTFTRAEGAGEGSLDLLIDHLEGEHEPQAFHDGLSACLEPLESFDPDHATLARLRALLLEVARAPAEPRASSAAAALARLSWRTDGARDSAHLMTGIEGLGLLLNSLAEADRVRGACDPDPLVTVFGALRVLCETAVTGGLTEELGASGARASVLAILQDPAQDPAARAAAAGTLGPLTRPSDGALLARVLLDPSATASVKHALLGALRAILPGLRPGDPGADALLAAVAELTGARDADLRRRALALCADARVEPLVRRLDPSFLVARLAVEESAEASAELLGLIRRFGRPDLLGPLLSMERFDALAANPALLDALAQALAVLSEGSSRATMSAAAHLAAVRSEPNALARLRHALALVAALDARAALDLYPEEHRAVAAWTWRIYQAGIPPRDAVPEGLSFEQRLLDVHLVRGQAPGQNAAQGAVEPGPSLGAFEAAHLGALLRADLFLGGVGRVTKPQVEAAFEGAAGLAGEPAQGLLVLRDRARFRAAANEGVKALSDYRRLLQSDGELLAIPDLRTAVELLARLGEPGGDEATAGEACDLLERIVQRRAWRSEPASVRLQDVRDRTRFALEARDAARLRKVEVAFADLPLTQVEPEVEREPPPIWRGLTREPAWFQELLDLRSRVRIALRELDAQG